MIVGGGAARRAGRVSPGAIGAGLLPIAVGYLVAHYLTYLLIDGQRIVIAISDPFQQGWDLFGTAFFEPRPDWLPAGPRVDGPARGGRGRAHARGVGRARDRAARPRAEAAAGGRARRATCATAGSRSPTPLPERHVNVRVREVPLAVVMVALTTITLWSLGQAIVVEPEEGAGGPSPAALVEAVRGS